MKQVLVIIIAFCLLIFSCKKEFMYSIKQNEKMKVSSQIDTSLFLSDTLCYSFGFFGDEEGVSFITQPKNSKSCKLLNNQWDERILQYVPQDHFLGIDSTTVVTMRGSDGSSISTKIDTTLIIIKVVKDEFHKKLIGRWKLVSSCGGYTGICWYPNGDNAKEIEFDNSMRYREKYKENIIKDCQYQLLNNFVNGQSMIYDIRLQNNYETHVWFFNDKLYIQEGDSVVEYDRKQ